MFLSLKSKRTHTPQYLNLLPTFKQASVLTISSIIGFIQASLVMVAIILLPKLIVLKYSLPDSFTAYGTLTGLFFQLIGCIFYGMVANRIGIAKTIILASLLLIVQALVFYSHLSHSDGNFILLLYALLGFCSGMVGLFPATLIRLFPTTVRLTSVAITYNCAAAITGAALPMVLFYFTSIVNYSPALYLTFIGLTAIIMGLHFHNLSKFDELAVYDI